jgi:hypothetical protein
MSCGLRSRVLRARLPLVKSTLMDRSSLVGMTSGAEIIFGFGIVWLLLGLFRGRPSPKWLRISLVLAGIALAGSIATLASRASGSPPNSIPLSAQQLAANGEIARHFYLIFGIELVAILVAVIVLNLMHYTDYILSGIALIVGVHFLPLAALFKAPLYYGTGICGCAIGIAGFFIADEGSRQKIVGISFGILLWATAAWITWQGLSTPVVHKILVM